jgi:hypothetical protein
LSIPVSAHALGSIAKIKRPTEKKRQAGLKALRAFKKVVVGQVTGKDSVGDALENAMKSIGLEDHVQHVREHVEEYLVEKMRECEVTNES